MRTFCFVLLLAAIPAVGQAQPSEEMPSVWVTRVFGGGGPVFGHGDTPVSGPVQSRPAFTLGIELSRAIADHVEVGAGAVQLWSKSYRHSPAGDVSGRSWSVLTGYLTAHYHVIDSSLLGVAVGPVISFSRREVFTVPTDDGGSLTLVSAGGPGAGLEARVAYPGGRCRGTFSLEAAMRYTAFRWLADRTRIDQRPLVVTIGIVVRH
jgi:hypothetical protein